MRRVHAYQWVGSYGAKTNVAANASVAWAMVLHTADTTDDIILRVHGSWSWNPANALVNGAEYTLGVGLYIADARAVTAGVASLPRPLQDWSEDWLMHMTVAACHGAVTDFGIHQFPFDSKAKRKFSADEKLCFIVENAAASSGTVQVIPTIRLLGKERGT